METELRKANRHSTESTVSAHPTGASLSVSSFKEVEDCMKRLHSPENCAMQQKERTCGSRRRYESLGRMGDEHASPRKLTCDATNAKTF